jgi:hypothetical protein
VQPALNKGDLMKLVVSLMALVMGMFSAFAQRGTPMSGIDATMIKMFGDVKAFTAPAEVHLLDKELKETSVMPMTFSLRDGKMRAELDVSEAKGVAMPPEAAGMMKQAGLDKMVTLIQPDKKTTTLIYPNAQACADIPVSEEEDAGKFETTELEKETVQGHPCKKVKLTSTDSKGKSREALVWQATDLKNFPIKMQMAQKSNTVIVNFRDPKLEAPPASQFEIPAAYIRYPSVQALMQAVMMKMFSGAGPK